MPRVHYITYLTDQYGQGVTGATVTVLPRYFATPVAAYANSIGTARVATPITTLHGKAEFWLDDGVAYNITSSGTGFQDYTYYFDAVSAESFNALRNAFNMVTLSGYATPYGAATPIGRIFGGYATPYGVVPGSGNFNGYATPYGPATPIGRIFNGYATPITTVTGLPFFNYATPVGPATPIGRIFDGYATPYGPASSVAASATPYITVLTYGADPTGVLDSSTPFINAFYNGVGRIPAGTYQINGVVRVPYGTSIFGDGANNTIIKLGAGGQIRHGEFAGQAGGGVSVNGGITQGIYINGNGVANAPGGGMYVGCVVNRTFSDVRVSFTAGNAVEIQTAQNCIFTGCQFQYAGGHALLLDNGTGGHSFVKCEIGGASQWAIRIQQSTPAFGGLYAAPSFNTWTGCIVEYTGGLNIAETMGGIGGKGKGMLYLSSGSTNVFYQTAMIADSTSTPQTTIKVTRDVAAVSELSFNNCDFYNSSIGTSLDIGPNCTVTLGGLIRFQQAKIGISQVVSSSVVNRLGHVDFFSVATPYVDPTVSAYKLAWAETAQPLILAPFIKSYGGGLDPGTAKMNANGMIHVTGGLISTVDRAIGDPIFTLPAGLSQSPNYASVQFCAIGIGGSPFVGGAPSTLAIDQFGVARLWNALPATPAGQILMFDFSFQGYSR